VLSALDPEVSHDVGAVVELIKLRNPVLAEPPGSAHVYVSVGYYLLGAIIERATGLTYGVYLDQVLAPAGLAATRFAPALPSNVVQGHLLGTSGPYPVWPVDPSLTYAVGGVTSTAGDLLLWQRALADGEIVSRSSYGKMITPTALADGTVVAYGLGLRLDHPSCSGGTYHVGRLPGYESLALHCERDDLSVVVLLNSNPADPGAIETIGMRISQTVLAAQR
jgi:CubicO group peptidase (beta-lactamase class C family)